MHTLTLPLDRPHTDDTESTDTNPTTTDESPTSMIVFSDTSS